MTCYVCDSPTCIDECQPKVKKMNELIKKLAKDHLRHEMYAAYGEIIEGDYYEFEPDELVKFVESIIDECYGDEE